MAVAAGFWVGVASSTIVGVGLWLLLPRGVRLTKTILVSQGRAVPDAWSVRNESSVPARVVAVEVSSFETQSRPSWVRRKVAGLCSRILSRVGPGGMPNTSPRMALYRPIITIARVAIPSTQPLSIEDGCGINLTFDDEVLETRRTDREIPWRLTTVPPGETLTVRIQGDATLTIRYKRLGVFGVFERRSLTIHGHP